MITIEKATENDVDAIRNVLRATWIATYGSLFSKEGVKRITNNWHAPERILYSINDKNSYIAIAKDKGKTVGVVTAQKNGNTQLHLWRLYVLPTEQGRGIGKLLFQNAVEAFPGIKLVFLEVEKMNLHAQEFYKRQGFIPIETSHEVIEGVTIEAVKMEKQL